MRIKPQTKNPKTFCFRTYLRYPTRYWPFGYCLSRSRENRTCLQHGEVPSADTSCVPDGSILEALLYKRPFAWSQGRRVAGVITSREAIKVALSINSLSPGQLCPGADWMSSLHWSGGQRVCGVSCVAACTWAKEAANAVEGSLRPDEA